LVVYAKTDPAAGARGITAFLIEKVWWYELAFISFACTSNSLM
jgi:alkylation response protein AidB-like acyl-CoA dehydrogenase